MCVQHSYSQCWLTLINFAIFICTRGQYKYGREGEQRMQTQGGPSRPDDICASAQLSPSHTRDSCPDVSEPPCGMCAHCLARFIRTVLQESKVDWFRNFHKNIEIKKIIGMRHPKKPPGVVKLICNADRNRLKESTFSRAKKSEICPLSRRLKGQIFWPIHDPWFSNFSNPVWNIYYYI